MEYTHLPKFIKFPWDEVNITSVGGGDEKQWSSSRHRLREENHLEETTAKQADLKDQEFWRVSKDHVTRIMNLGMTPRQLSGSPSRLLAKPPPRVSTPPPRDFAGIKEFHEEPKHLEQEEGGEFETLEITVRQSRQSGCPRLSALERIYPPRSRSVSAGPADRNPERSRS